MIVSFSSSFANHEGGGDCCRKTVMVQCHKAHEIHPQNYPAEAFDVVDEHFDFDFDFDFDETKKDLVQLDELMISLHVSIRKIVRDQQREDSRRKDQQQSLNSEYLRAICF